MDLMALFGLFWCNWLASQIFLLHMNGWIHYTQVNGLILNVDGWKHKCFPETESVILVLKRTCEYWIIWATLDDLFLTWLSCCQKKKDQSSTCKNTQIIPPCPSACSDNLYCVAKLPEESSTWLFPLCSVVPSTNPYTTTEYSNDIRASRWNHGAHWGSRYLTQPEVCQM